MTEAAVDSKGSQAAQTYYDSDDADRFYSAVWGGEDIHIGLYEPGETDIKGASVKTMERMLKSLGGLSADDRVADLGAGYGGGARHLAKRFGCTVECINISRTQNAYNQRLNKEQGLDDKVIVRHGSFEHVPADDASFDVVWSQDAFLHSDRRDQVMAECWRILKPGGQLIFTDPMEADDADRAALQPVYDRIHLENLGSIGFYRQVCKELGFEEVKVDNLTPHLGRHYYQVREHLKARYDELKNVIDPTYMDRMIEGLTHWVTKEQEGQLAWGILHFRKPAA
ncbi:sarcosine/dimethylglycine N-methyltransferase [Rhodothalassium salexigens DSM 2132]|uniref:Sarcosine/dimethylglycine N-methyltransferase n=1 Tax=Rhodothalassium salexigens DSM 2132 TaxID=1188247 RepID=A0A4R2PJS5_RHOSA|nr:methyltransferase domain-containing protein [Rhodothalassium salexigens]MBB4211607.1 sarcosine/dimethylglycine N-methyltransferase [Rhodothalassium salexigens DSM 2132]MBK1639558.1 SAM-dependent methyltransferase [Rhodothalassium salexigens DSM 2132]TCP34461.1 sarcosine/dimethylglycine N-methyltransferase [Rhodothalassium salexigens DSM 2132]